MNLQTETPDISLKVVLETFAQHSYLPQASGGFTIQIEYVRTI